MGGLYFDDNFMTPNEESDAFTTVQWCSAKGSGVRKKQVFKQFACIYFQQILSFVQFEMYENIQLKSLNL